MTFQCTITVFDNNWREYELAMQAMAANLRSDWVKRRAHFTVIVAGFKLPVHRLILASSPVFRTMMESGMQESRSCEIVINDFSVAAVKSFLDLLYMDHKRCNSARLSVKLEVLRMADKYNVKPIIDLVSAEVGGVIDDYNCISVYETAKLIHCAALEKTAIE